MGPPTAQSIVSAKQRDGERGAMLNSPVVGAPLRTREKDPPRYGAQHRQNALWKGGNGALPPEWRQFELLDGPVVYQDNTLGMVSFNRPFPGVRLDGPRQLVPRCEWLISPLGRSYFVNHNTRTTSWRKPISERPPGSLTPECVIEGHSKHIWSLTCLGTSFNIMSASGDGSLRQWTRNGEPVGKPLVSDGDDLGVVAVSPDQTMVVSGSTDGRLRLWDIRKGSMVSNPWEGHNDSVECLDWSPNGLHIASGSEDGTIRRWNTKTGRQIAAPIETGHGKVWAVKYSPRGDKLTSSGEDKIICVWSNDGELLMEINGHEYDVRSLCWSKDGAYIFSASGDRTIRKWQSIDGTELFVFRGHTNGVSSLCLSPDERHLVSASMDCSVRIWDLKTEQSVGNPLLHDDEVKALAISRDGKYIASAGLDGKISLWSMEAALKQQGDDPHADNSKHKGREGRPRHVLNSSLVSKQQPGNKGSAKYGKDFWDADTNSTPRRAAPPMSPSSGHRWRNLLASLRFSTRPTNEQGSVSLEPGSRRWNFNLFNVGSSIRTVYVAPGRKKDRIAIAPPTAAELARAEMAAAMQNTNGNEAGSSTQPGRPQAAPGIQVSQGRPTETQGSSGGTVGEVSNEVRCCGLFGCRRLTSHQS